MQMYKALIADFDNTLVGIPSHTIPGAVGETIRTFIKKGSIFTIATGRPWVGIVRTECKRWGIVHPQIVSGGAAIFDPTTDKALYTQFLPRTVAKQIIEFFQKENVDVLVQTVDAIHSAEGAAYPHFGSGVAFKKIRDVDYSGILELDVSPFVSQLSYQEVVRYQEKIVSTYPDCSIKIVHSEGMYGVNVTSLRASKYTAILRYLELMGLKPEETVGVGDSHNDYPLLTACGYKVAMADAPKELLEIADMIVPPQKENGILEVFHNVFGL